MGFGMKKMVTRLKADSEIFAVGAIVCGCVLTVCAAVNFYFFSDEGYDSLKFLAGTMVFVAVVCVVASAFTGHKR